MFSPTMNLPWCLAHRNRHSTDNGKYQSIQTIIKQIDSKKERTIHTLDLMK